MRVAAQEARRATRGSERRAASPSQRFGRARARRADASRRLASHGDARNQRRIARQVRDQALAQRDAVPLRCTRRSDSIFIFAMSTPVGHSRLQPLHETHRSSAACTASPRQVLVAELARQREAQRVGAPARRMLLVARDAIARAHRAGVELAAMAVVVAHLDGLGEAAA